MKRDARLTKKRNCTSAPKVRSKSFQLIDVDANHTLTCTLVYKCCKDDQKSQWEKLNFEPTSFKLLSFFYIYQYKLFNVMPAVLL